MQRSVERKFVLTACARYGAWASASGYGHCLSLPCIVVSSSGLCVFDLWFVSERVLLFNSCLTCPLIMCITVSAFWLLFFLFFCDR